MLEQRGKTASLQGQRGWVTLAEGVIRSLQKFVEPVLIVSRADEAAAGEKFPNLERWSLPTIQAEDWNGTTASMLRRMIPALAGSLTVLLPLVFR